MISFRRRMELSIIIPAYNEASRIGYLISHVLDEAPLVKEVLGIDGLSEDETQIVAHQSGAKVIRAKKRNRAHQMNLGAKKASGDVLHFIHSRPADFPHS